VGYSRAGELDHDTEPDWSGPLDRGERPDHQEIEAISRTADAGEYGRQVIFHQRIEYRQADPDHDGPGRSPEDEPEVQDQLNPTPYRRIEAEDVLLDLTEESCPFVARLRARAYVVTRDGRPGCRPVELLLTEFADRESI
jgi:hypothetical protein